MFLHKNYILSNELTQKMGIHIANISMLRKQFEDDDSGTVIKRNNCTFINIKANNLPNNIRVGISQNTFTDMTNKLPCTFVRNEYSLSDKELMQSSIIKEKTKIAGKDFYVFTDEFVKQMKNKNGYVLNKAETMECINNGDIDGYIQITNKKYFTWY